MSSRHVTPVGSPRNNTPGEQRSHPGSRVQSPDPDQMDVDASTSPADSEMEDVVAQTWTTIVNLSGLGQAERQYLMARDDAIYSDKLDMGDSTISTKGIFDLRGSDIPLHLTKPFQEARRRECVLGLQRPAPTTDEFEFAPDDDTVEYPEPTFVGASIKPSDAGSQERDNNGQPKSNSQAGGKK